MAISHTSEVLGAANSVAGNYDTSITPASTPNGVCVIVVGATGADDVASVQYGVSTGAVMLTRRRWNTESTEAGGVWIYWGNGVFPAGAQTVRVIRANTSNLRAAVWTMSVAAGMTVQVDSDASGLSASVANPSWTHTTINANTVAYEGIHSGLTTMTTTPATNWTLTGSEDTGAQGRGWARRTLATAGSLAPGWISATADDFVGASIAFYEAPPAAAIVAPVQISQIGRQLTVERGVPQIF